MCRIFLLLIAVHFSIEIEFNETKLNKYCALSNCKIEFASEYEHINYYELDTIPGIHDDKNRLNFKFFAIGKRDVHVLFTPIKDPTDTTMVYEFVIGGRSNAIVVIRKRKSSPRNLMEERRAPILQLDQPNEIQITISNGGNIKVVVNQDQVFQVRDNVWSDVKYLSFASYYNSSIEYFYNCTTNDTKIHTINTPDEPTKITNRSDLPYVIAIMVLIVIVCVLSAILIRWKSIGSISNGNVRFVSSNHPFIH